MILRSSQYLPINSRQLRPCFLQCAFYCTGIIMFAGISNWQLASFCYNVCAYCGNYTYSFSHTNLPPYTSHVIIWYVAPEESDIRLRLPLTTRSTVIPATSFIAVVSATAVAQRVYPQIACHADNRNGIAFNRYRCCGIGLCGYAYNLFDLCECISYQIRHTYLSLLFISSFGCVFLSRAFCFCSWFLLSVCE